MSIIIGIDLGTAKSTRNPEESSLTSVSCWPD
jgi:hypothetical protein